MTISKGRGKGFASLTPERRREIASSGGIAAHRLGTAHVWTSEEAQQAGKRGGTRSRRLPRAKHEENPQEDTSEVPPHAS